ncbi:hypothetical protein JCM8547_007238 [Rhodosporidiobolus lusitaniae]
MTSPDPAFYIDGSKLDVLTRSRLQSGKVEPIPSSAILQTVSLSQLSSPSAGAGAKDCMPKTVKSLFRLSSSRRTVGMLLGLTALNSAALVYVLLHQRKTEQALPARLEPPKLSDYHEKKTGVEPAGMEARAILPPPSMQADYVRAFAFTEERRAGGGAKEESLDNKVEEAKPLREVAVTEVKKGEGRRCEWEEEGKTRTTLERLFFL